MRKRSGLPVLTIAMAGMGLLGGCKQDASPQLSGNHGGLMPGMVAPPTPSAQRQIPVAELVQTSDQLLPDGHILRTQNLAGRLYTQTWFTTAGRPERAIFYSDGSLPVSQNEYGPEGQLARVTTWFPGTNQASRVEEYVDGNVIARFTTYWPNGNLRVISESALPSPDGPINRVQQWYENGRQKSLAQNLMLPDGAGRALPITHGRQVQWDDTGRLISDAEFEHGVLRRDYLQESKVPAR